MNLVLIENQNKSFLYKQIVDGKIKKQSIFDDSPLSKDEVEMYRLDPEQLIALYTDEDGPLVAWKA